MSTSQLLVLRLWPDEILRTKCVGYPEYDDRLAIGHEMIQVMIEHNGLGLSAPQVGLTQRIFVMRDPNAPTGTVFCNPIITNHSDEMYTDIEGCLSVPGRPISISRFHWIDLEYEDAIFRTTRHKRFMGLSARCIQHEIDHLDGILIFDHINSNLGKKLYLEKYMKKRRKHARIE